MSSIDKINVGGVDFDITSSPTPVMAPVETGTTATQAYAVGDYVIVGSTLHEVTAAIAIDDTFTEGTNISTSTSLGDEIKQINNDLTANSNKFEASYQNGKYGFTINNTFYEIGGGSMPALDYDNPLHTFDSALTYTATKTCYLLGTIHGTANNTIVSINDTPIFSARTDTTSDVVPLTRIDTGDVVKVNASAPRLHVFEEK